jgi:hypothetical protein
MTYDFNHLPRRFANDPAYASQVKAAAEITKTFQPNELMLEIDAGEAKARIIDLKNNEATLKNPVTGQALEMDIALPAKNLYLNKTDDHGQVPREQSAFIDSIVPFPKDNHPGQFQGWDPMAVAIALFSTAGARDADGNDIGSQYNDGSPVTGSPYSAFHGWGGSLDGAIAQQNRGDVGVSNDCWRATNNPMAMLFGMILQAGRSRFRIVHNRFKTFLDQTGKKIMLRSNPYRPYQNVYELDVNPDVGVASTPRRINAQPRWDLAKLKQWVLKQLPATVPPGSIKLQDAALNKALNSSQNETLEVGTVTTG